MPPPQERGSAVWSIAVGVLCLLAVLPVANFMLHALWLSGHPVDGVGERGAAWGRRADLWFGVLVVLLGVVAWCVWGVVRRNKRGKRSQA